MVLVTPLSINMPIAFYPILYVAFSNIAISMWHLLEKERHNLPPSSFALDSHVIAT